MCDNAAQKAIEFLCRNSPFCLIECPYRLQGSYG